MPSLIIDSLLFPPHFTMNNQLTEKELFKVYLLYENYGPEKLGDFIRMIWKEAYELGYTDAAAKIGIS